MKFIDEISNAGLLLSMEFGENWLKDINARLLEKYPTLKEQELERYNKLCKKVNKTGNDFVRKNPVKGQQGVELMTLATFNTFMLEKYVWINEDNLGKLYSQSCYYAFK